MIDRFNKLLASYSVTRTLYDSQKGIYDILRKYIAYIIFEEKKYSFTSTWITSALNEMGSFELKESVVKTCLKQMEIEHVGELYTCKPTQIEVDDSWNNALNEADKDNKYLVSSLIGFLGEKGEDIVSNNEEYYIRALCDYIVDGSVPSNDKLTEYICEYVVENENDDKICGIISRLKEGTVIHEGIRYCDNYSELYSRWKGKLTLYLDTEILLGIAGYNSSMLQSYCVDFIELVKELNHGADKQSHISLKYFDNTYTELEKFFDSAVRIVRGQDVLDTTKEAIEQVVDGCFSSSDVEQRRSNMYHRLEELQITKDSTNYYDAGIEDNKVYNIESLDIEQRYSGEWNISINDIHRSLAVLSNINKLRKGKSDTSFERCGFVFLTATNRTKRLSYADEIYKTGDIPLATSLDFVINRFWLRLNKGFGEGKKLRTLDMVTRARTLLSGVLGDKVYRVYQRMKESYENGEMTKEEFVHANNELKEKVRKPEEISVTEYEQDLDEIEKWDFREAQKNYLYEKEKLNTTEKELKDVSEKLAQNISEKERISNQNQQYRNEITEKEIELSKANQEMAIKDKRIHELEAAENERTEKAKHKKRIFSRILLVFSLIMICAAVIFYILGTYFEWPIAKPLGAVFTIVGCISVVAQFIHWFYKKFCEKQAEDVTENE